MFRPCLCTHEILKCDLFTKNISYAIYRRQVPALQVDSLTAEPPGKPIEDTAITLKKKKNPQRTNRHYLNNE